MNTEAAAAAVHLTIQFDDCEGFMRTRTGSARFGTLVVLVTALCSNLVAAQDTSPELQRVPSALRGSVVPGYPDVVGEYLQISGGGHAQGTPRALDTAAFLRVRSALDGESPRPADAVIIAMPGFSSVPSHWLYLAAQLVHKANARSCATGTCRLEVWVIDRRGSNLEDTVGLWQARVRHDASIASDYYDTTQPDAKFKQLTQADVPFEAEWGFETHASDVDAMIALAHVQQGAKNVFLAGHSQGGAFISSYAGRLGADGKRGFEKLAGLIALDPAPLNGSQPAPADEDLTSYFTNVSALRSGASPVFTDATGPLPLYNGPSAGSLTSVAGVKYAVNGPDAEAGASARQMGSLPSSPAGDAFLKALRLSNVAIQGMGMDTEPVPGAALQNQTMTFLGEGLGKLDFAPLPGTENNCDPASPQGMCIPDASQVDPNKVYGWIDAGGSSGIAEVGNAHAFGQSQAYSPSRTNVYPIAIEFAVSGRKWIYAGAMNPATWYPSNRYDSDMSFLGTYHGVKIDQQNVALDIDRDAITIPIYMARQSDTADLVNVQPLVTDYTEINRTGAYQTPEAAALSPVAPAINVALYHHTDFVSADDSAASSDSSITPGQPGVSAISNTLIDWVLARARGKAYVPSPRELGVRVVR
jgi:pimeloyl-ACP methyl ester carboxylesterase